MVSNKHIPQVYYNKNWSESEINSEESSTLHAAKFIQERKNWGHYNLKLSKIKKFESREIDNVKTSIPLPSFFLQSDLLCEALTTSIHNSQKILYHWVAEKNGPELYDKHVKFSF